ncbi:hypothetical protein HID58_069727 [Brassica napus]|uniref:BnaC06g02990D protein n=2 Tax=Brassica napus TaxID=3708 RepID=A0A078GU03_BRANA|nr:hypothetical protein HID58_069727 [Brassica napus]CAF2054752.1 unnamed protein product [Brassica napus]CDY28118.1 BnaC06g02990D [Brassica napus]
MITLPENEENKKWRPPEQLLVSDETQKIDLFNLGTIVHQILVANTKAQNSFLRPLASLIRSEAEACYLITKLKIRVAESRLSATEVSVNLLFWPSAKKLKFIGKFGDGMKKIQDPPQPESFHMIVTQTFLFTP